MEGQQGPGHDHVVVGVGVEQDAHPDGITRHGRRAGRTPPIEQASEDLAAAALDVLLAAVRVQAAETAALPIMTRVAEFTGEPVRDPAADRDGRYGWDLPYSDGRVVRLLMPGVALPLLRDDVTAGAPCLL